MLLATVGRIGLVIVGGHDLASERARIRCAGDVRVRDPCRVMVNNTVLIVSQGLNFILAQGETELGQRAAMEPRGAILTLVRTQLRLVLMAMFISICRMLPLVLMPGSGCELYRGMKRVVVGRLFVATLFHPGRRILAVKPCDRLESGAMRADDELDRCMTVHHGWTQYGNIRCAEEICVFGRSLPILS